jgi:hypothetical protein
MDPLRTSVTNEEQRAFIKLHYLLDDTAAEIHKLLQNAARSLALSRAEVYHIYNQFRDGERQTCERLPGSGRPRTATTEEMNCYEISYTTIGIGVQLILLKNWESVPGLSNAC